MKTLSTLKLVIIYTLLVFGLALLISSCGATNPPTNVTAPTEDVLLYIWRAKVLENGTITRVEMTRDERIGYQPNDTVWVNLRTHRVDDASDSTMACVLGSCRLVQ